MTRKLRAVIPAILCVALAASACSKKEETPTFTGDKTEEPSYQANLDFVTPAAYSNIQGLNLEPGTYISIIGKDESSSYWKEVKKGVEQAVKDLNKTLGYSGEDKIKATFNAPDGEDIDEQVNILDEELARYPDALGIASIDEDACKVQFDAAAENGIPVIALDSGNTYQGIQCTVKTNNTEAAKQSHISCAMELRMRERFCFWRLTVIRKWQKSVWQDFRKKSRADIRMCRL